MQFLLLVVSLPLSFWYIYNWFYCLYVLPPMWYYFYLTTNFTRKMLFWCLFSGLSFSYTTHEKNKTKQNKNNMCDREKLNDYESSLQKNPWKRRRRNRKASEFQRRYDNMARQHETRWQKNGTPNRHILTTPPKVNCTEKNLLPPVVFFFRWGLHPG